MILELPKSIKNKIRSMVKHSEKAYKLEEEIRHWYQSKVYDVEEIEDILIDSNSQTYDAEGAIYLIENKENIS